jgi:hypothetical protein
MSRLIERFLSFEESLLLQEIKKQQIAADATNTNLFIGFSF